MVHVVAEGLEGILRARIVLDVAVGQMRTTPFQLFGRDSRAVRRSTGHDEKRREKYDSESLPTVPRLGRLGFLHFLSSRAIGMILTALAS